MVFTTNWSIFGCHRLFPLPFTPSKGKVLPFKLIRNVSRYKFNIRSVSIFTDDVQVNAYVFWKTCVSADQNPLIFWIFFNNCSLENSFYNMLTFKTFFQGMLYHVAFDEIVSDLYSFTKDVNIHAAYLFVR